MAPMSKRSSHASQLRALGESTTADYDPENAENHVFSDEEGSEEGSDQEDEEVDESRSHYTNVGKSLLRNVANETPLKESYKGTKSSRRAIFEDEEPSLDRNMPLLQDEAPGMNGAHYEDDEGLSDRSIDDMDQEESGSEGDMAAFEDEELDGSELETVSTSSGSDQSQLSYDSEESESESEANSEDERQAAELKKMLADDEIAMVQDVVKSATADAEKGKAVKKQLAIYDSLLTSRIKLKNGLQSINIMSDSSQALLARPEVIEAQKSAVSLLETIFTLRTDLMAQDNLKIQNPRKRKYDDGTEYTVSEIWEDIRAHDAALSSWRDTILNKWSNKIQSASTLDKAKKFKALNQGILAQLEESKSDRAKLRRRTQIKRYKATNAVSNEDISPAIYDDGDFYQEMLKDLIDSRMLDSNSTTGMKWMATKQPKQKKENLDTRASKGRKLRYHVHEKIQNFMAPQARSTWHEAQIDELFGSLLGQKFRMDEDPADEEEDEDKHDEAAEVVVEDGFRLFG